MKRMGVDQKLINITKSLYTDTVLCVELDGYTSDWLPQNTGLRQGCPLSPYLFLIFMTTLFHDVHLKVDEERKKHRVPGADFDEVTYADDTICISKDIAAMNHFIKAIETEGNTSGMKRNKQTRAAHKQQQCKNSLPRQYTSQKNIQQPHARDAK